jgi:flagellar basal-body rod protein FlgG
MIRSLYTAVSGMIATENKQNTVVNNMTNANTIGYKADNLVTKSFNDVIIRNQQKVADGMYTSRKIGKMSLGVAIDDVVTRFEQGDLKQTDSKSNFAINGNGFFTVRTADGIKYTRDGQFSVNNNGNLINSSGDLVLGIDNAGNLSPINVGNSDYVLDTNNNIVINGVSTQKLAIADFADYKNLGKVGDNYYETNENPTYIQADVRQGFLEMSNVNVLNEMVDMISVMRNFETNQKFVSMIDESLGKAANEVGKV